MQTVSRSNFTTVTTEGAILPADLLQRIADGQVDGLAPTDYHLAPNERLNEAINRSWNRLLGVWEGFDEQRRALPDHDRGTTLTRERWLRILFDELGYGRIPHVGSLPVSNQSSVNSDQSTDNQLLNTDHRSPNTDPRYPISHSVQHIPLHLITFRQSLDRVDEDRGAQFRRSPHSLLQEFLNRTEQHLWGIVANGLRLRLLRDNASFSRAAYLEFDLEAMFSGELYADFTLLWLVCHLSRLEIRDWRLDDDQSPISTPQSPPSECWLERWSQHAAEQGTRALDSLRDGVTDAISRLGRGFLAHPANGDLRSQLQSGDLDRQDYFRQLLRLVYRLIFLFVAEDRNLLLIPGRDVAVQRLYNQYYSVTRLRDLAAARRSGPHPDLYRGLRLVMLKLREGYEPLGLPGLGGFLFSPRSTPALDAADIANEALLDAIRALTFTIEKGVRRPVDYKNLGAEELGSVYESLLELHPELNVPAATFDLRSAAGSERKTTGSYYTPTSLINSLLDTALEPVIHDRVTRWQGDKVTGKDNVTLSPGHLVTPSLEEAILNIKVVDPACGSGHFLIAAANRLARHLARIRTGDGEPSPEANRQALRDVVGRCIYGVDINEMSVELCKVALWLETLDPGKPLSFLDANIQCGNSLLGATPALLARGIPDEAFTPITGDDKAYCTEWKKRNREQRKGQLDMFARGMRPWERLGNFAQAMRALEAMADDTVADVARQQAEWERLVSSSDYEYGKLWADAWAAAFVWRKRPEGKVAADGQDGWPYPITEQVFREIERSPHTQPKWLKDEVKRLAAEYQFFHWHLAFPQVFTPLGEGGGADFPGNLESPGKSDNDDVTGWDGGFDVVLGNPPWEQIQSSDIEFFAPVRPDISSLPHMSARKKAIKQLQKQDKTLHEAYFDYLRKVDGLKQFLNKSGLFPLGSFGRLNTAPLFTELSQYLIDRSGKIGIIVPSGLATDSYTQGLFRKFVTDKQLKSLYEFENTGFFLGAGQGHMVRFCLLTLTGQGQSAKSDFMFQGQDISELKDKTRKFQMTVSDFFLINPNTGTCPIFRTNKDYELVKSIYQRIPVLDEESNQLSSWKFESFLMVQMNTDSDQFNDDYETQQEEGLLTGETYHKLHEASLVRLYEAKMMFQFTHRYGDFRDSPPNVKAHRLPSVLPERLRRSSYYVSPRYWLSADFVAKKIQDKWSKHWFLVWRNVTDSRASARTVITSFVPHAGISEKIPIINSTDSNNIQFFPMLCANLNSFVLDYVARQKIGGIALNTFYIKQFPMLTPSDGLKKITWHSSLDLLNWLMPRVIELVYTAYDLRSFAQDFSYHGPPFRWDAERRFLLRCELDAAYFHLYGIGREDVAYIMDTFPIVRRKDEAAFGEYRTKRVILEIYDEMAEAIVAADSNPRSPTQETRLGNRGYNTRLDPPPGHPDAAHPWDEAYLGPELPRDEWWQDVDDKVTRWQGDTVTSDDKVAPSPGHLVTPSPGHHVIKEPAPKFTLQHPTPPESKGRPQEPKGTVNLPPSLTYDFTPPSGGRSQRLKRVMALGRPKNSQELQELIAALGDEDSNIRWLAGSSLARLQNAGTVAALAAYLATHLGADAQAEVRKVLGLIADTSEDAAVQQAARQALDQAQSGDDL